MASKKPTWQLAATYLAVVWFFTILPLPVIVVEFRSISLCGSTFGWHVAKYYGAFFIYPFVAGLFCLIYLFPALTTVFKYAQEDRFLAYSLLSIIVVMAPVLAALEFASSPFAIFEINPDLLKNTQHGKAFLQQLDGLCDPSIGAFKGKYAEVQGTIASLTAINSSYTRLAYHIGFIGFTIFHLTIFCVFGAFVYMQRPAVIRHSAFVGDKIFILFGLAIALGAFWGVLRLIFRFEDNSLFGLTTGYIGDFGIIALYLVLLFIYLVAFVFDFEQYAGKIATVAQIGAVFAGIYISQTSGANRFLGSQATLANYITLVLVIIALSFISFLFTFGNAKLRR